MWGWGASDCLYVILSGGERVPVFFWMHASARSSHFSFLPSVLWGATRLNFLSSPSPSAAPSLPFERLSGKAFILFFILAHFACLEGGGAPRVIFFEC
jgi:hypothetical protein